VWNKFNVEGADKNANDIQQSKDWYTNLGWKYWNRF
jgi:hypothetical protein